MLNRLPNNPVDGQIAIDSTGTRYKYYAEFNEWISIGNTVSSQLVNYQQNGMATPDAIGHIEDLRDATITDFKLLDNEDAYYYMLQSSTGRLFLFTVEGQNARIELNRNALSNLFLSTACQGTKGIQGIAGVAGDDGLTGPNESTYTPQVDGPELSIAVEFEITINTEVSFRLFNGDRFVEIWYDASASETSTVKQSTEVVLSHVLNVDDGLFTAVVVTDGDWGDGWTAKVRQRGPDGRDGTDGNPFIEVVDTSLYALKSTEFIASARSTADGAIFYISQPAGDLPTAHIRPHNFTQASCEVISLVSDEADASVIIGAVEPSIDSNKLIRRWIFEPTTITFTDPDLPVWIPDPSCATKIEFSWWEQFEDTDDECQVKFTEADALPERCCQEDFFFCPNIGPCPVLSGGPFQGPDSSYTPPTPSHTSRPSLSSSSISSVSSKSSSSISSVSSKSSSSVSSKSSKSSKSSSSRSSSESSSSKSSGSSRSSSSSSSRSSSSKSSKSSAPA